MKQKLMASGAVVLALGVGVMLAQDKGGKGGGGGPKMPGMALTSPDFEDGGIIPPQFTQQAADKGRSPKLEWTNVPPNTQSFVLIMHDPDNALNKGTGDVLHWMVINIPGTAPLAPAGISEGRQTPGRHDEYEGHSGRRITWGRATPPSILTITTPSSSSRWIRR